MAIGNTVVSAVLRSPLHRMLSGSTDLIRYTGRRSGRQYTTPTQYAQHGDDLLILVGRPETKTWWRNFEDDTNIEVLVRRRWIPMTARAIVGADEPATIAPLLDAYLQRFPRAGRAVAGEANDPDPRHAVLVRCRRR